MIYYLSQYLLKLSADTEWADSLSFLRLFRYITFRSGGAALTALLLSWWLGPKVIAWLKRVKFGQEYQDKAAETGLLTRGAAKMGTPTMGGILIVPVMDFTALLWAQWNTLMLLTLLSVVVLAGLGFYDDFAKITQQSHKGAAANAKLWVQSALALFIALYLWRMPATSKLISEVMVPFHKSPVAVGTAGVVLGLLLTAFAIVGSSNAVNLTDGLDGLAIGCTLIVSFVFLVLTYVSSNGLPAGAARERGGRVDGFLRGNGRRGAGILMVQLSSGARGHGGHRIAGAGRRVGDHRGVDPSAAGALDRGRSICGRGRVRDGAASVF